MSITIMAVLSFGIGLFLMASAGKVFSENHRYEFEHTTEGGTVEFENYEAYMKYERRKAFANVKGIAGFVLFIWPIIMFFN